MIDFMNFINEISFLRVAGSEAEKEAADIIEREIASNEGESLRLSFSIPSGECEQISFTVNGENIEALPLFRSGSIDSDLKLLYLDNGMEEDFAPYGDLSGYAVLLNELNKKSYKRLTEHNVSAFIFPQGKYYMDFTESSIYSRNLRPHFLKYGAIPTIIITSADASKIVASGADSCHITLTQTDTTLTSANVLAEIPGTDKKDEIILLTAHYDSVPVGTGAWDNATGAAALLRIHEHFIANPPARTMRFLWCGSEEMGLLGSKDYAEKMKESGEDKNIKFCFNFDMNGTILGPNLIFLTGKPELTTYAKQFCRKVGYAAEYKELVHSSDSAPFADLGIPSIGISRGGMKFTEIHTIKDLPTPLSAKAFEKNMDFAIKMISDVTNACLIPVEKGMSDERLKELDEYFQRTDEDK